MTYSAVRRMMPCRPCFTFTSGTRLWVRRAVWPWWAPAGIFLRPALASWSSTFRSAKLSARLRRTHNRHTFSPRLPHHTSRHKSTRRTRSSVPDCESFNRSRLGAGEQEVNSLPWLRKRRALKACEEYGDSFRLHLKGLKNVWILFTQNFMNTHVPHFHSLPSP